MKKFLMASLALLGWLCALLVLGIFTFCWDYAFVPLNLTSGSYPCVEAVIGDQVCLLELDLVSKLHGGLKASLINEMQLAQIGEVSWRNINNEKRSSEEYLVPSVKLGKYPIQNFRACLITEDVEGADGFVSWHQLKQYNLLLNVADSGMYLINGRGFPSYLGFSKKDFVMVPYKESYLGFYFELQTEFGTRTFELCTTATHSILEKNKLAIVGDEQWISSSLSYGTDCFGEQTFAVWNNPPAFQTADGWLGLDFLRSHVVFIDHKNRVLYIEKRARK